MYLACMLVNTIDSILVDTAYIPAFKLYIFVNTLHIFDGKLYVNHTYSLVNYIPANKLYV